ncbi:MAG TPA: TonB-dependent receptor plug domain-containing protein [Caulobacteraceae bacterium]
MRRLFGQTAALAVLCCLPAIGGTALAAEPAASDEIIVTGTRVAGLRAVDSPAPIQVLGAPALARVGSSGLIQALALNTPSFNAQAIGGDMANETLSARLRGLSPNHVLVLINGKRRHGTANLAILSSVFQGGAAADLDMIPVAAIRSHRGAAGRGGGPVWLGRHRRGDQHHPEVGALGRLHDRLGRRLL